MTQRGYAAFRARRKWFGWAEKELVGVAMTYKEAEAKMDRHAAEIVRLHGGFVREIEPPWGDEYSLLVRDTRIGTYHLFVEAEPTLG